MKNMKTRTVNVTPTIHAQLKNLPISISAAVSQAVVNAYENDSLLVQALKRRLAVTPLREKTDSRLNVSQDTRIDQYIEDLAQKCQMPAEYVIRLAIEAFIHKL